MLLWILGHGKVTLLGCVYVSECGCMYASWCVTVLVYAKVSVNEMLG